MCILNIPTIIFADFESIEYYWLNYVINVFDDSFILASMHAIWDFCIVGNLAKRSSLKFKFGDLNAYCHRHAYSKFKWRVAISNCQIKTSPAIIMRYFYTQTHTLTLCACILSIPIVNYLQNGMISRVQSTLVELCYQCLLTL